MKRSLTVLCLAEGAAALDTLFVVLLLVAPARADRRARDVLSSIRLGPADIPAGFRLRESGAPTEERTGVTSVGQVLQRDRKGEPEGKDPTVITIGAIAAPDPSRARKIVDASLAMVSHPRGVQQSSLTGRPLGEVSWAPPPDRRRGSIRLRVLDGRRIVTADVQYQPVPWPSKCSTGTPYFQEVSSEDQRLAEQLALTLLQRLAEHGLTVKTQPAKAAVKKR